MFLLGLVFIMFIGLVFIIFIGLAFIMFIGFLYIIIIGIRPLCTLCENKYFIFGSMIIIKLGKNNKNIIG